MQISLRDSGRKLDSYDCLVALRPQGTKPPLFLVCWEGGRLAPYRQFIRRLPPELPVYGLRAPLFDGRTHLCPTLEDLARLFLAEVRRFHPEPPYLFGGYCFGGTLAHEMAAQLEEQGVPVCFLGAIESSPYGHGLDRSVRALARKRFTADRLKALRGVGKGYFVAMRVGRFFFGRWGRVRQQSRWLAYRTVSRTGWRWPAHVWNFNLITIRDALERYVAPASNTHLTLFETHDGSAPLQPSAWLTLVGGGVEVEPIAIPGVDHVSVMREPYVGQLADRYSARLDAALRAAAPLPG